MRLVMKLTKKASLRDAAGVIAIWGQIRERITIFRRPPAVISVSPFTIIWKSEPSLPMSFRCPKAKMLPPIMRNIRPVSAVEAHFVQYTANELQIQLSIVENRKILICKKQQNRSLASGKTTEFTYTRLLFPKMPECRPPLRQLIIHNSLSGIGRFCFLFPFASPDKREFFLPADRGFIAFYALTRRDSCIKLTSSF